MITKRTNRRNKNGADAVRISIDDVFDKIINIDVNKSEIHVLKDVKLDLKEDYEYDISLSYKDAYAYLRECLMLDQEDYNKQKLLDMFLMHQYLNYCYFTKKTVNHLAGNIEEVKIVANIICESFFCYRAVGAFKESVKQYEILGESKLWLQISSMEQMQIMKEVAKAYRNIGDFDNALNLYYNCLLLNSKQDWLHRVELLLKIGKVYRNYLMQTELARFYVEEAYRILEENGLHEFNEVKEKKYAVICLDTLGQIYRDEGDFDKAKEFFQLSKKMYGKKGGRAQVHEILMQYQKKYKKKNIDLKKDIELLTELILKLNNDPMDEIGIGIRSIQMAHLIFKDNSRKMEDVYEYLLKGREIALKYNDIKTTIRSYMEEAYLLKKEKNYVKCIETNEVALKLASDNNQLVLENKIIKEIIELSNKEPNVIDSVTKIELIKRRKDIYEKLVGYARLSIDLVKCDGSAFSKDRLIELYQIVINDFEQISGELGVIIEILNIEVDRINQKYLAYLDTEIKGVTYKNILHKFKNDLPEKKTMNKLRLLIDSISLTQPEEKNILMEVHKQLETFETIIAHIKKSAGEALRESQYEKKWCLLDKLIQTGIHNYIYSKPKYKKVIKFYPIENVIEVFVQSSMFETTIYEIIKNAFDYAESVAMEKEIEDNFKFYFKMEVMEKRVVVLECYSIFWSHDAARNAEKSIRNGMDRRVSTKEGGSRYGLYSIKFLFEELMGGDIQIKMNKNEVGISIRLPVSQVSLKIN